MKMITVKIPVPSKQFWVAVVSILLSVFMVSVVVYGASTIDTASVGAGTSTPGAALGVKGAAIIEGFVHADYFYSTSTNDSTFGGAINVTEAATSTFTGGITAGTGGLESTGGLRVNAGEAYFDERVGVGTTSPASILDVGTGSATSTVIIRGGAAVGGEIILKSSDGEGCISIIANRNGADIGADSTTVASLLTAKVIACPGA